MRAWQWLIAFPLIVVPAHAQERIEDKIPATIPVSTEDRVLIRRMIEQAPAKPRAAVTLLAKLEAGEALIFSDEEKHYLGFLLSNHFCRADKRDHAAMSACESENGETEALRNRFLGPR